MSTDYKERQDARRQRLEDRADQKTAASASAFKHARQLVEHIPFGQPILVGHHSEKGHRNTLSRSHSAMDKGVRLKQEADSLRQRAASVGEGGISSDDPTAIEQLRTKLAKLEAWQDTMKRINRQYKKGGWDAVDGISDENKAKFKAAMERDWRHAPRPFEAYMLSNNNAVIRQTRQRIADLQAIDSMIDFCDAYAGFTAGAYVGDNRVRSEFDSKPNRNVCKYLRSRGFVFSRQHLAWQRKLNASAVAILKSTARALEDMDLY